MLSKKLTALLLAALVLAGCGKSNEELINAAVPLGLSTAKARDAFFNEARSTGHKDALDDLVAQMKARALACAPGYAPSGTDADATRRAIGNEACFTAADARLEQWLGARRVGFLSAMDPIRGIPEQAPAQLTGTGEITTVDFASDAGVALVAYGSRFQLFDLGSAAAIGTGYAGENCQAWTLSPNGRVAYCRAQKTLYAHAAESGELLLAMPIANGWFPVHPVAGRGLVYAADNSRTAQFLDFSTGESIAIPGADHDVNGLIPIPGEELAFAMIHFNSRESLRFVEGDKGLVPQVSGQSAGSGSPMDIVRPEALVGDTVYYTNGVDAKLQELKLPSLELQTVSLKPMDVVQTMPTADPDKVLVNLRSGDYGQDWYQVSLSSGQLARLQTRGLGRMRYIATLKANAWVDGNRLVISKSIPVGVAMSAYAQAPMLEAESRPASPPGAYPTSADPYQQTPPAPTQFR